MAFQPGQERPAKAGRKKGTLNKKSVEIAAFARSVLEDPEYRQNVRMQAQAGVLSPTLETLLYGYAYGRPAQRLIAPGEEAAYLANEAFMKEFIVAVLGYVKEEDARLKLKAIIAAHISPDRLKLVA